MELSQRISNSSRTYLHSKYQATVAATVIANTSSFKIVTLPPGSGKTCIIGLLANHLKETLIVVPNDELR